MIINWEIEQLILSWGVKPKDVNKGNCEEFAMTIIERLGGYSDNLYELCTENFDPQGELDLPGHVWVFFKGRHYDAEMPNGVKTWRELPIFQS